MKTLVLLLASTLALADAATTAVPLGSTCNDTSPFYWQSMDQMFFYSSDVVIDGEVIYKDVQMYMDVIDVICVLKNNDIKGIPSNITIWGSPPCRSYMLFNGDRYLLGLVHLYENNFALASNTMYQHAIYPYNEDQYYRAVGVCGLNYPMPPVGGHGCSPQEYKDCNIPMTASGVFPRMTQSALFLLLVYGIF